ncbi:family 16 glycosylhydrolase [Robertkochia solimangrovi]|uniref:family 16 glycosylhydrolase n=1 Tax=Robertkochia solimangrovi TaxID=2213046 RepID=UPI00117E2B27|nr:family 16 glycosylhydrolase [Robertkochia solimangrovi]TRZ44328.1 glycoside hydrolase [Robertkochia solimangrovi]
MPIRLFIIFLLTFTSCDTGSEKNGANPGDLGDVSTDNKGINNAGKDQNFEVLITKSSFDNFEALEKEWNYNYPWGSDHNGSARMTTSTQNHDQISLDNGVLTITATPLMGDAGKSSHPPYLKIKYHAASLHAKQVIQVNRGYPKYELSGEFKAPVDKGTWPAFWITAVNGWPPESDILEFKGDSLNWQNTFITPKDVFTEKTAVPDAPLKWHKYSAVLEMIDDQDIMITYYTDGERTASHKANFTDKPMWVIINLQMEGSSGSPGPSSPVTYQSRNVELIRYRNQ